MNLQLTEKYQPRGFADVWGQDYAIRVLSGHIRNGQSGRDLLLYGAVGSGKTTLARLYAAGLNCDKPLECGSPCWHCPSCTATNESQAGLFEYDVPRRGGKHAQIESWLKRVEYGSGSAKTKVIFFDEAHRIEPEAADFLLKSVEDRDSKVIYCFATTEPHRLRHALVSRLWDIEIRQLNHVKAIEFLRFIADREEIKYEPEAIALLAGLRHGFPRDLLNGLDRISKRGSMITIDQVKDGFDIEYVDDLIAYFLSLADGELESQVTILEKWNEPAIDKCGWIQALLTSLYYNDILNVRITVDSVSQSIGPHRNEILRRFCARLGLEKPQDLEPYWSRLMEFWRNIGQDRGEASSNLTLAMLSRCVNQLGLDQPSAPDSAEPTQPRESIDTDYDYYRKLISDQKAIDEDGFFGRDHAEAIFTAASFLVQVHGLYFDSLFTLHTWCYGLRTESQTRELIAEFCADLEAVFGGRSEGGPEKPAMLITFERGDYGLTAHVLAYLPADKTEIRDWSQAWRRSSQLASSGEAIRFQARGREVKPAKFHWRSVRYLCGGLSEQVCDWDDSSGKEISLLLLLNIPKSEWRDAGALTGPRVIATGLLLPETIAAKMAATMPMLNAFREKAWRWIGRDWEINEFDDRQDDLFNLQAEVDANRATGRVAALTSGSARDVNRHKELPRSWTKWW